MSVFHTLTEAEAHLIALGFKPTGIADWTSDHDGADAGVYVEDRNGADVYRVELVLAAFVYYAAAHAPIYVAPSHLYRCTATPRPSDCIWLVPPPHETEAEARPDRPSIRTRSARR